MSGVLSAVIILLILGVLIVVHELGHYIAAKKCGVKVLEFAIGMGPVFFRRKLKTADGEDFTLRALPIGGFCAMEGEDANSVSERSFGSVSKPRRFIILFAGSAMNLLLGLLLCFIYVVPINYTSLPVIEKVEAGSSVESYFQSGDEVLKVNGHRIMLSNDIGIFLQLGEGHLYNLEVKRDGQILDYKNVDLYKQDFGDENGMRIGFSYGKWRENTIPDKIDLAFRTAYNNCRLVWISLGMLVSGSVGADALMGPVGMGAVVNEVVTAPQISVMDRVWNILSLTIMIAINLGIANLLPLPALDGGRILFLAIEAVIRRPIPVKFAGFVHGAGMILLFGLMIFVMFNDIIRVATGKLFGG